jgi:hypothetical protein
VVFFVPEKINEKKFGDSKKGVIFDLSNNNQKSKQ